MKIKIYCQSFVLPYLEATNHTQDFQFITPNQYTDFLQKAFQDLSPQNITILQLYKLHQDKTGRRSQQNLNTYNSPLSIEIDSQYLHTTITDQIQTISIIQYDFTRYVKKQLLSQFITMMNQYHILQKQSITQTITNFYNTFDLDEDTLISENLRTHWRRNKPYKAGGREIFRNKLLSTQYLSHPTAQNN